MKSTTFSTQTTWPADQLDSGAKSPESIGWKRMGGYKHTMGQSNNVPDDSKEKPGDKIWSKEVEASPGPWEEDGGNEEILQDSKKQR